MALKEIKNKTEHYFVDANGERHGEYKRWWWNGNPMVYCYYLNDALHGEYRSCHGNGNQHIHCYYLNSKLHGEYKSWWENGDLYQHTVFVNGTKVCNLDSPSEEDKILLSLEYGVTNWL